MGIGYDQLHAAQTAAGKAAQEVGPEDLGFGMADRHAESFAPAVTVDANGDDDGDQDDAVGPPDLYIGPLHPEVGPVDFDRAIEEGLHTHVVHGDYSSLKPGYR